MTPAARRALARVLGIQRQAQREGRASPQAARPWSMRVPGSAGAQGIPLNC